MRLLDPLARLSRRASCDYAAMAAAGVAAVVEPAGGGPARTQAGAIEDDFAALLRYEPKRAEPHGVAHRCALGIDGRHANDRGLAEAVLWLLPRLLERDGVVAVGEVGFDEGTREEEEALARQLELARRFGLPVIARIPAHDAGRALQRTLGLVGESGLPDGAVLVAGAPEPSLGAVLDAGCWAAVGAGGDAPAAQAPSLLRRWGKDRLMFSGEPDGSGGDPLAVPAARRALLESGAPEAEVRRVLWDNPSAFFGRGGRFEVP